MDSAVKDGGLAPEGDAKIDLVAAWAPVLSGIAAQLAADGSVAGRRIGIILPIEPKTAYLAVMLADAGAEVALAAPGALTRDDVAAAVAGRGVATFARSDSSPDDEERFYAEVLARRPEVVIDDRAELVRMAHTTHREALPTLIGASEETTTGVVKLRAMQRAGALEVPCIAANDANCKHLFDNRYGTGQSSVTAILDSTNLQLAGKRVLVIGYGWVGKGVAARAAGLGARVTVSEVNPFAALEAIHEGYAVAPVREAAARSDVVISATGVPSSLPAEAIERLPDGALLANAGAVDDEIDVAWLRRHSTAAREARPSVEEFVLPSGRSVYLVGDGKVVNLSAGEGHPVEIMDLTFAVQALSARHLLLEGAGMAPGVHPVPEAVDRAVADAKLASLGVRLDQLSQEQSEHFVTWQ
ncbi:MAG TPA: adenosylhomocysteinase [Acidimicrobiales bacterium]|nr:adenosylhomocysteinase [Acidimicrobiales bacterium]